MKALYVAPTPRIPEVDFNAETGILKILGRLIPEDSSAFFEPLLKWLNDYPQIAPNQTIVEMRLEYINTSSGFIMKLFESFEEVVSIGKQITVKWYYEEGDDDLLEIGKDYESVIRIPFKYICIPE